MLIGLSEKIIFTNILLSFLITEESPIRNSYQEVLVLIAHLALKSSIILCKAPILALNFLYNKWVGPELYDLS